MPTLKEVQDMISALGDEATSFGTKKEIQFLPEILKPDEVIIALTSGMIEASTWLITCTNKRIIFLDKGMIYGLKQIETPLDKINSVEMNTGMIFGKIAISDGSSKMEISNIMKKTIKPFVNKVQNAIEVYKSAAVQSSVSSPSASDEFDVVTEIKRFATLRDEGILSEEEFQTKKRQLLA